MSKQGTDTLVILSPGFAASEEDINCLPMQQAFVRCLKESYPALHIIILAFQYPYFKEPYQWHGITVISFAGKNKGGFARLLLRRRVYSALSEINRQHPITGLLSFWYGECALVGNQFAGRNKLRHFCWLLGQDAREGNKYIKYVKLKETEMIALSDFLQDEFERNYGDRPKYMIPSGFDVKQLQPLQAKRDIDLLAAGSLISLKRFDVFIAVVAEIKKLQPGIKAVLVGDGPEKKKLQVLIAEHGLAENITLTGELPHAELLQLMQRTKIFLHPSSYEGFSGVCQEALACGAQVISFCRAMNRDIEQWHIVNNKQQMVEKTVSLLQQHTYKPVVPFAMTDVVRKMMGLFSS
jgi:glycosyltransferase involved in cell wall biosynthesis